MNMNKIRLMAFLLALAMHAALMAFWIPNLKSVEAKPEKEKPKVIKLIDVRELQPTPVIAAPPPPQPEAPKPVPKPVQRKTVVRKTAEKVVESKEPESVPEESSTETSESPGDRSGVGTTTEPEPDYLPQSKIKEVPKIDINLLSKNTVYPPIARSAKIEGTVTLELFISKDGEILSIKILKEAPTDMGFGAAAVAAFKGLRVVPAKDANGRAVSTRYRYPFKFRISG